MRLFINEKELQLTEDTKIAQTKQVNNLMSIETRQTNYTNSFKIRKTKPNIATMEMLGVIGNLSGIPYNVNRVDLFGDTGECFVYQGRCTIMSSDAEFYDLQIIDGNVDIYKAIANDKLSVLDLTAIEHERTIENIIASWSESSVLNYKYIVADFNGKSTTDEGYLNADYLVPSIKVSYLWDAIFSKYGFTYSGTFFDSQRFKNLWITYPKGAQINESETIEKFTSAGYYMKQGVISGQKGQILQYYEPTLNELENAGGNMGWKFPEAGTYRVRVHGKLTIGSNSGSSSVNTFSLSLGKNLTGAINVNTEAYNYPDWVVIEPALPTNNAIFDKSVIIEVNAGDSIYLMLKQPYDRWGYLDRENLIFESEVSKINEDVLDFGLAFQDFGVKEFFSEIITRHALVPIKDKYTNNYVFHTLDDLINKNDSVDWSDKFTEFEKESYLYNSYEQRNYFRYKYDAKEAEHNDGYLEVNNLNLDDKATVYQSQLYSPESAPVTLLETSTNVYRLWDKKIDKDLVITYDPLSKHFYFVNYVVRNYAGTLKSEFYDQQQFFVSYPIERFTDLSFYNAITNNYKGMGRLLNRSAIITAKFKLNDYDITNLDFSRKVYAKQLGYDFFINKVSNYLDRTKPVSVELVRISENTYINSTPTDPVSPDTPINRISWLRLSSSSIRLRVHYQSGFFSGTNVSLEIQAIQPPVSQTNDGLAELLMSSTRLYVPMNLRLSDSYSTTEWFGFILNADNRDTI